MEFIYYINGNGEKVGPVKLSELSKHPLMADTPVWTVGMTKWVKASEIKELEGYYLPDFIAEKKDEVRPPAIPTGNVVTNSDSKKTVGSIPPAAPGMSNRGGMSAKGKLTVTLFGGLVVGALYFFFCMPINCLIANVLNWSPLYISIILGGIVLLGWLYIAANFVKTKVMRIVITVYILGAFGGGALFINDKVRDYKFHDGECLAYTLNQYIEYLDADGDPVSSYTDGYYWILTENKYVYDKWGSEKYKTIKTLRLRDSSTIIDQEVTYGY